MSRTPETLTFDEANKLLAEIEKPGTTKVQAIKSIRNLSMLLLMLDAGLRVGEVVRLRCTDLWLLESPVNAIAVNVGIAEKGCARTVPCTPRLQAAIVELRARFWLYYHIPSDAFAFAGAKHSEPISARQIERIIAKAAMASINRTIWPHVLRHTFASRLMRTSPASVVQKLLGHSQLASTQVYMHANGDDAVEAIKSLT